MPGWIRRIKQNPAYQEWHFEIGILALFLGLALVVIGVLNINARQDSASAELRRHDAAITRQAREGAAAHRAICAYKIGLIDQIRDEERFLRMSRRQRILQFGDLGKTPDSVIRAQMAAIVARLHDLKGLRCPLAS